MTLGTSGGQEVSGADIRETVAMHSKPKAMETVSRQTEMSRQNRTLEDTGKSPIAVDGEELLECLAGDPPVPAKPVRL